MMGVSLDLFRASVGMFAPAIVKILTRKSVRATRGRIPRYYVSGGMHTRFVVLNLILMLLFIGGVELNPGPETNDGVLTRSSTSGSKGTEKQMKLTSQGTEKTLQTLVDEVRSLSGKIDCVQRSHDSVVDKLNVIEENLKSVSEHVNETNTRCLALEEENMEPRGLIKSMDERLDYLENQSRRCNVIFHGVPRPDPGESWADCEGIVQKILQEDMKLPDVNIQRAHRIMKGKAIIVKLRDDKDKHSIFKASKTLKDSKSGMYITEDFSLLVRQKRKKLSYLIKARENDRKAQLRFDKLYIEDNLYAYDVMSLSR